MANSISPSSLRPNVTIMVSGTIAYSEITRLIEGDRLIERDKRLARDGRKPVGKEHTAITIENPQVIPKVPGQLSLEEEYIQNKFYTSHAANHTSTRYAMINKSKFLPKIAVIDQNNPNNAVEIVPEGELANGLQVRLLLTTYQVKNYASRGVRLDQVIVMEPIRYFSQDDLNKKMADYGMTYTELTKEQREAAERANLQNMEAANRAKEQAAAAEAPADNAPAPATAASNPYVTTGAAASAQTAAPAHAQNAPQGQASAAMTPPTQQTPPSPWQCSACGNTNPANTGFCGVCGTKKPDATTTTNPFANQQGVVNTGLNFDPNENRDY